MPDSSLHIATYLSGYKPIPSSVPGWDQHRQATWPATTATLVSAAGEMVLIDALMTTSEGKLLGDWLERSSGGQLTTVYVTHGHADHFFGATEVLQRFPDARLVARADVARAALEQASPGYLQVWSGFFPDQITDRPAVPEPMNTDQLTMGEHVLQTIGVGYSDVPASSVVHIPELGAVVCGDVAYNGMHMWLAGSTAASRVEWLQALDTIETLQSRTIIFPNIQSSNLRVNLPAVVSRFIANKIFQHNHFRFLARINGGAFNIFKPGKSRISF